MCRTHVPALSFATSTAMPAAALLPNPSLRARKIRVQQDISVLGFDNMPIAFRNNLSSYDFNLRSIINLMISYILHPSMKYARFSAKSGAVTIEGSVIERGTVAKIKPLCP
jgi:DNA-binding LacI/PurR family transcriptional regulator